MASTETTRIQLEFTGADAIANSWRQIGNAARTALRQAQDEAQKLPRHLQAINTGLGSVKSEANALAARLGPLGQALTSIGPAGLAAAAGIGAIVAAGAALVQVTKHAIDVGSQLDDLSKKAGVSAVKFQELVAVGRDFGVQQETIANALATFRRNVGEAALGSGTLTEALKGNNKALLEQINAAGSAEAKLNLFIDAVAKAATTAEQARLANAGFGKGARELLPAFSEGAAGIEKLIKAAHESGTIIEDEFVHALDAAGDAMSKSNAAAEAARVRLGAELAPAVRGITEAYDTATAAVLRFFAGLAHDTGLAATPTPREALAGDIRSIDEKIGFLKNLSQDAEAVAARGAARQVAGLPNEADELAALVARKKELLGIDDQIIGAEKRLGETRETAANAAVQAEGKSAELAKARLTRVEAENERYKEEVATINKLAAVVDEHGNKVRTQAQLETDLNNARLAHVQKLEAATHDANKALSERETILAEIARAEKDAAVASLAINQARVDKETTLERNAFAQSVAGRKDAALQLAAFDVDATRRAEEQKTTIREQQLRTQTEAEIRAFAERIKHQSDEADKVAQFRLAKETELAANIATVREQGAEKVGDAERKVFDEQNRLAEANAKELAAPFLEAGRAIQATLADAIGGVFDGSVNSAGDAADAILGIFKKLAAELAALLIGRVIIGPALSAVGLGGYAQQLGLTAPGGTGGAAGAPSGGGFTSFLGGALGLGAQFAGGGATGAAFTAGGTAVSAYQRAQSGQGFGVTDVLGYAGMANQAANLAGYGFGLSGPQGAGLYFNGAPLYSFSEGAPALGGFGAFGAGAAGGLAGVGGLAAIPGAAAAVPGGIAGTTLVFDSAGTVIGITGGSFGAGASVAPEFASQIAAQYAVSGATSAGTSAAGTAGSVIGAAGTVLAAAALVYSLYSGAQGIASTRAGYNQVTLGSEPGKANLVTGVQAGLIGGLTVGGAVTGAVVGSIFPGVGNIVGAIVGAGVGAGLGSALSTALGSGINTGIGKGRQQGATQAQLNKKVQDELAFGNATLDIISSVLNPINLLMRVIAPKYSLEGIVGGAATPNIEKIFDRLLQKTVETNLGRNFNRNLDNYLGQGPLSQRAVARFQPGGEDRNSVRFFTALIADAMGAGSDNYKRTERLYTLLVNNLGGANRRGGSDAIIDDLQKIIRRVVPLGDAFRAVNAQFLQPGTTTLRTGRDRATQVERTTQIVEAYIGRGGLPSNFDVEATVKRVLDQRGYVTRHDITREAGLAARESAEQTGELFFDPLAVSDRPDIGRSIRGRSKRKQARRQALYDASDTSLGIIDAAHRALAGLADPAKALTHAFGDIQTSFNAINALQPRNLEQLPDLLNNAMHAIEAYGRALLTQFDTVRQLTAQVEAAPLQIGEEVDALRRSTTTHQRYNDVLDAAWEKYNRLVASGASAAAQFGALGHAMDLLRQQAQAEIQDIQEAAQVRLEAIQERGQAITDRVEIIGPLAQLAGGLHDQLQSLTDQFRRTSAVRLLSRTGRELRQEQSDYATTTGRDRAEHAAEIQRLINQRLEQAGQLYGIGSPRYRAIEAQAIRTLRPIDREAAQYEKETRALEKEALALQKEQREIEKATRDAVRVVQERLADQLEGYATPFSVLLETQRKQNIDALKAALPPGTDVEALLADPIAAQVFVANLQLDQLELLNDGVQRLVDIANTRGGAAPFSPVTQQGGLQTVAGINKLGGVILGYAAKGGTFEDLKFTGALGDDWTRVANKVWARLDEDNRRILIWMGSNPPGPAGGAGQAGTLGRPVPYLQTGGDITGDGLAYLHAGERVLSAAEARVTTNNHTVTIAPVIHLHVTGDMPAHRASLLARDAADHVAVRVREELARIGLGGLRKAS